MISRAQLGVSLIASLCSILGLSLTGQATPRISRVEVSPCVVDLAAQKSARIRFYLSDAATATIRVFDADMRPVRTMQQAFQRGYGQVLWDGRNDEGRAAVGGVYAVAVSTDNTLPVSTPATDANTPLSVYGLNLDRATRKVSYRLTEPAHVQIRLGIGDGGPLLRTIDTIQGPGHQAVQWDGWDQSRAVNVLHHENVVASVRALSLPENSIIVHDETTAPRSDQAPFRIRFLDAATNTIAGAQDRLAAEILLGSNPAALLGTDRYEWVFFVDHRFLFEEEGPIADPYRFQLAIGDLSQGEHVLTVNLVGREDNSVMSFSERFERRPR